MKKEIIRECFLKVVLLPIFVLNFCLLKIINALKQLKILFIIKSRYNNSIILLNNNIEYNNKLQKILFKKLLKLKNKFYIYFKRQSS